MESALLGPARSGMPTPGVAGEVLGHRLVGVRADLTQAKAVGVIFSQAGQSGADPAVRGGRQDSHVVRQQVARPGDKDGEASDPAVLTGGPRLPAADRFGVVGGHRSRVAAHTLDVLPVRRDRDRPERIRIAKASEAEAGAPSGPGLRSLNRSGLQWVISSPVPTRGESR